MRSFRSGVSAPEEGLGWPAYLRRWIILAVSVALPSLFLVFLSFRLVTQEHELSVKRMEEARIQAERQFASDLQRKLDEWTAPIAAATWKELLLFRRSFASSNAWVAGVAVEDRLIPPWEYIAGGADSPPSGFADHWMLGRRLEFAQPDHAGALSQYLQALERAETPSQAGLVRLAMSRVYRKSSNWEDALRELKELVKLPQSVTDELGVPIPFYAAGMLLLENEHHLETYALLEDALLFAGTLSPVALTMAGDLLERLSTAAPGARRSWTDLQRLWEEHRRGSNEQEELRKDYPYFRAALRQETLPPAHSPRWLLHGAEPSLVGLVSLRDEMEVLVAVPLQPLLERVYQEGNFALLGYALPQVGRGSEPAGYWLGDRFHNLQLLLPRGGPPGTANPLHSRFLGALAAVIVGVTLFASYLWWRDTRRELQLAKMRSDFVSSVSHELKTPLTSVRMFAETLILRELSRPEQHQYLEWILSESDRLTRLLNNILDSSKIESGSKQYHFETVDLNDIARSAAASLQLPIKEKGFELRLSLHPEPLWLRGDPDGLEQSILNLLQNALKYSGASRRIQLRTALSGGQEALVEVGDEGMGIAPHDHRRIFERFQRTKEALLHKIPGTGLGLALVKHALDAHQGRIQIQSALGRGSTFSVFLPLCPPAAPRERGGNSMTISPPKSGIASAEK
jgi:signal transduction histidine kinase